MKKNKLWLISIGVVLLTGLSVFYHLTRTSTVSRLSEGNVETLPLEAQFVVSETLGKSQKVYQAKKNNDHYVFLNPSQSLEMRFDGNGALVKTKQGTWGLSWVAQQNSLGGSSLTPSFRVEQNRVTYDHGSIEEWYVNGPYGIQQGFTLKKKRSEDGNRVTLRLKEVGNLKGYLENGTLKVTPSAKQESNKSEVITYGGLYAYDAQGKSLPVWMEKESDHLLIHAETLGADYPIVIDPFIRQARALTSYQGFFAGHVNNIFGWSTALSGNRMVIGAPYQNVGSNVRQGAAYVFSRLGTSWVQEAVLIAGDGAAGDIFGAAVGIDGDRIVVAAPYNDIGSHPNQGAVYFFSFSSVSEAWSQEQKIVTSNGMSNDNLGYFSEPTRTLVIEGDTLVVGSLTANGGRGAVYVFNYSIPSLWTQQQELTAIDGNVGDFFGSAIALSGNMIIVGAYGDDIGSVANQGAAYVFTRLNPTAEWQLVERLTANDGSSDDNFGFAVAASGNRVVIGAPNKAVGMNYSQGAIYVFTLTGSTWSQVRIVAERGSTNELLGRSISFNGLRILGGARGISDRSYRDVGGGYLFSLVGSSWLQVQKLTINESRNTAWYGDSVALDGDYLLLATGQVPKIYVFHRSSDTTPSWTQQQQVKTIGGAQGDQFGYSVSATSDRIVVGAPYQDKDGNMDQGAAFVFLKSPTTNQWSQEQALFAFDGAAGDHFGSSVAMNANGNKIAIGAPDVDARRGPGQGAAYIFVRSLTSPPWSEEQKLVGSATEAGDHFGSSISMNNEPSVNERVIVGVPMDDVGATVDQGSVYTFFYSAFDTPSWSEEQQLIADDGATRSHFGHSVSLNGDRVIVGAPDHRVGTNDAQGKAYVFSFSSTRWALEQALTANNGLSNDQFGSAVSIHGDGLVVGAPGRARDPSHNYEGAAYIFSHSPSAPSPWSQEIYLTPSDSGDTHGFGKSVSIHGDIALVGAPTHSIGSTVAREGSAYLFFINGSNWTEELLTSVRANGAEFGSSVAISGGTAVVGIPLDDAGIASLTDRGSVDVFLVSASPIITSSGGSGGSGGTGGAEVGGSGGSETGGSGGTGGAEVGGSGGSEIGGSGGTSEGSGGTSGSGGDTGVIGGGVSGISGGGGSNASGGVSGASGIGGGDVNPGAGDGATESSGGCSCHVTPDSELK